MFKFFSRKAKNESQQTDKESAELPIAIENEPVTTHAEEATAQVIEDSPKDSSPEPEPAKSPSWFSRLRSSLSKTRNRLSDGLSNLILGKKELDDELLDEIETQLLVSDVGVETTEKIISHLTDGISRRAIKDPAAVLAALKTHLSDILEQHEATLPLQHASSPTVILMIGINGAGKTTTIGKLAAHFVQMNKKVMLAAGDTFRAAAIEQLKVWGERNEVPVIAQSQGADSASVIYDALNSAKAKDIDILLADTAGRLHTRDNLMEELKKVKRVLSKQDPHAPHEVLLVLDAGIGQNALLQAKEFHKAIGVTGLILTKLDGTAKGGIIFTIADQLKLPIYYIGVGEQKDDLRPFVAKEFVAALFGDERFSD